MTVDLTGITCNKVNYICNKFKLDKPKPKFTLTKATRNADVGCAPVKCLGTYLRYTLTSPPHLFPPPLLVKCHQHVYAKLAESFQRFHETVVVLVEKYSNFWEYLLSANSFTSW